MSKSFYCGPHAAHNDLKWVAPVKLHDEFAKLGGKALAVQNIKFLLIYRNVYRGSC